MPKPIPAQVADAKVLSGQRRQVNLVVLCPGDSGMVSKGARFDPRHHVWSWSPSGMIPDCRVKNKALTLLGVVQKKEPEKKKVLRIISTILGF